jgi:hypothetical protein
MNHFTRSVCVVDTCSIINLDEIILDKKDVLFYMRQFFDIRVSCVIREEFIRHRSLAKSREASYWVGVLSNKTYAPIVLRSALTAIGPFYTTAPSFIGPANAGEHENMCVALELLLSRQAGHAIFVTDDEKASNAFLSTVRRSFPGVELWTSVDVILYLAALLMKEGKADFDSVKSALRDVYAAGAKKWEQIDSAQKSAIIRKRRQSVESLRIIKSIVDHWRH